MAFAGRPLYHATARFKQEMPMRVWCRFAFFLALLGFTPWPAGAVGGEHPASAKALARTKARDVQARLMVIPFEGASLGAGGANASAPGIRNTKLVTGPCAAPLTLSPAGRLISKNIREYASFCRSATC